MNSTKIAVVLVRKPITDFVCGARVLIKQNDLICEIAQVSREMVPGGTDWESEQHTLARVLRKAADWCDSPAGEINLRSAGRDGMTEVIMVDLEISIPAWLAERARSAGLPALQARLRRRHRGKAQRRAGKELLN